MLSFYGNGAAAGEGGSTVEQLWERGNVLGAVQQITTASTYSNRATGNGSVAEGLSTTATAECHSEGFKTAALKVASHAEGFASTADGSYSHVEGYKTLTSTHRAHAEGLQTTASGIQSHAEGGLTLASGEATHAEGHQTTASGLHSHAEGEGSQAIGQMSHAEGWLTTASGFYSHTEGRQTQASGQDAHAEGQGTTASGIYAHAQNGYTLASGNYSHAQNKGTIAASTAQTALGTYNIEDNQNQYAVILGNGTGSTARSNAAMIDWDGNMNIAGSLTLNMNSVNPTIITPSKIDTMDELLPEMEEFLAHMVDINNAGGQYEFVNKLGEPVSWQELKDYAYILREIHTGGEQEYIVDYQPETENGRYYIYITSLAGFDTTTFKMKYNRIVYGFSGANSNIASQRIYDVITVSYTVANN